MADDQSYPEVGVRDKSTITIPEDGRDCQSKGLHQDKGTLGTSRRGS